MKKNLTLQLSFLCLSLFAGLEIFSQTTTIDYQSWTGASGCNVFASATIVGTQTHLTNIGQPTYDNTNKSVNLVTEIVSSLAKGTQYQIGYSFQAGYAYNIVINAADIGGSSNLRIDLNNGSNGTNTLCSGTGIVDPNLSGNLKQYRSITGTTFSDYSYSYPALSNSANQLVITSIPPLASSSQTILIRKITITAIPPPVSISPASVSITCGSTTAVNLRATTSGLSGITNYIWNLGATPNNWLLNGTAAPANIATGTVNTLTLTPVCGALPKNVSVTVTANGVNYGSSSNSVSIAQPTLSIAGQATLCSGCSDYSIVNLPCNASVLWSITPSDVSTLSCTSCTTTSMCASSNGTVTVSAIVSNLCGGTNVTLNKSVLVGYPQLTGTYSTATSTVPLLTFNSVKAGNIFAQYTWPSISNISASLSPGSPQGTGFSAFPGRFSFNIASGQNISVIITGTSPTCGAVSSTRTFFASSFRVMTSPNPTRNFINITLPNTLVKSTTSRILSKDIKNESQDKIKFALHSLATGVLVKQWSYFDTGGNTYRLNISGIKAGTYIISVERGGETSTNKVVVQ